MFIHNNFAFEITHSHYSERHSLRLRRRFGQHNTTSCHRQRTPRSLPPPLPAVTPKDKRRTNRGGGECIRFNHRPRRLQVDMNAAHPCHQAPTDSGIHSPCAYSSVDPFDSKSPLNPYPSRRNSYLTPQYLCMIPPLSTIPPYLHDFRSLSWQKLCSIPASSSLPTSRISTQ
ncbi:hypothetical protein BD410DRAFT_365498 [Rickenella mellea]|uniref:Uncharacterized protein n=1 Tax=Rickenella mellea TaxID=50990 RepID=A0A4Y7PER7_9AGAM|nr:hypothetical protein BD410DRAFT_365498 [Rickenella mellea]